MRLALKAYSMRWLAVDQIRRSCYRPLHARCVAYSGVGNLELEPPAENRWRMARNEFIVARAGRFLNDRFLPALQYSDYRKLWYASMCSQSSAWALIVARGALAKSLTGSDMWTGLVTFAAMIPSVLISPLAGYLADRFDRRAVMLWSFGVNLAHNLLLAFLVVFGAIEAWHLVLLAVVNGSARSIQMPAASALLANTVPPERLFNGVALQSATLQGSRFLGPLVMIVMLWVTDPWLDDNQSYVFFLSVLLYVMAVGFTLRIRTTSRGVVGEGSGMGVVARDSLEGLSYMYRHPLLLSIILLVVAHCAMVMSFESLFPAVAVDKLGMNPESEVLSGFGILMVAFGFPALLTSMALAGVTSDRIRGRLFLWTGVLSGITPIALAYSPNLPLAILAVAGMGASQSGFMLIGGGMLQAIAPDAIRGRLMSVYTWHILGFMASFNLVNGTLASIDGITASLVLGVGGILFVATMAFSFIGHPLRSLYGRGIPAESCVVRAPAAD